MPALASSSPHRHLRARGEAGSERTTTVELFFDLVYVFAITQLSHLILGDLSGGGVAGATFLLVVVWWAWISTTWMTNWFDPADSTPPWTSLVASGRRLSCGRSTNERTHSFGELKRAVPGVSEKMLTQQLRELEGDGIVHRAVYDEIPPRVEYSLTEVGVALNAALAPLGDWGEQRLTQLGMRPTHATT